MGSRSVFCAFCLTAALAAVACGTDDDGPAGNPAGGSGKGNAGSSGKGNAGSSGKAGDESGGADNAGGAAGTADGTAGEAGQPSIGCTHLSEFVHAVIKDDTSAKSSPRPVNSVVFCDDPADPAAYDDLF
ncbi:MAG: hypothetical protein WDO69_11325 [Pseudomonadota bacterium]